MLKLAIFRVHVLASLRWLAMSVQLILSQHLQCTPWQVLVWLQVGLKQVRPVCVVYLAGKSSEQPDTHGSSIGVVMQLSKIWKAGRMDEASDSF